MLTKNTRGRNREKKNKSTTINKRQQKKLKGKKKVQEELWLYKEKKIKVCKKLAENTVLYIFHYDFFRLGERENNIFLYIIYCNKHSKN